MPERKYTNINSGLWIISLLNTFYNKHVIMEFCNALLKPREILKGGWGINFIKLAYTSKDLIK